MFQLEIMGVVPDLPVVSFRGNECVSSPYEFELDVLSGSSSLARQVGQEAKLTWTVGNVKTHRHGILASVTMIGVEASSVSYRLKLVPTLAKLDLRSNCRVFQEVSVVDVLGTLLDEHGIDSFRVTTIGGIQPKRYLVQYRETDLEFFQRLLEEEGMFYYFEHNDDDQTLIVADNVDAYQPVPGRSSRLQYGLAPRGGEQVSEFTLSSVATTETVRLRDYNFEMPSANLDVAKKVPRSDGSAEFYDYPGGYESRSVGQGRVRQRLDSRRVLALSAVAATNSPRLAPGRTFRLTGHGHKPANAEYVVIKVVHEATRRSRVGEALYRNTTECIGAKVPYRSVGRHPRLIMQGPQTATVVGPVGEEIHVDAFGRVKVQFHWDRAGQYNENSSAWIRVAQTSAGNGWGSLAIPRVGHEVIVDFIDGDPDRPVIVGSLYNGINRPPAALPDDKTQTVLRTQTSPGGGGSNELLFDDATGDELVALRSQKDLTLEVANDVSQSIGGDSTLAVEHNSVQTIGDSFSLSVGSDFELATVGDSMHTVGGCSELGTGTDLTHIVGGDYRLRTGGDVTHTIGKSYICTVETKAALQARSIHLGAVDEIKLEVGDASISMKENGEIAINGVKIDAKAIGRLTRNWPNRQ